MNAPSQSKPSAILVGGLIALGVIASLVTALATSDGPSANPDSVSYLRMAAGLDPIEHPLGHFPPGYPLALRGLHGLGSGWIGAGRWLGISLAGLNAVLAGLVSWRIFRSNGWAFATAIALASATTLAPLNVGLFSEPLFFTLIFAWLLLIDATRSALLVVCGIVAAASFLVRFAGVSLLLASVALLWSTPRRLLLFAAGAAPPLLFWALTRPISAEVESRPLVWHPPPPHALAVGVARTTEWISGETGTFWSGCLILIVAVFLLWRAWQSANSRRLAVVAGCYVIVLALTMTLFYAQTPLDPRLLAPVQVLVLVSAPVVSHIRPRRFAIGGGCAVVALNIFATWGALRPCSCHAMSGGH